MERKIITHDFDPNISGFQKPFHRGANSTDKTYILFDVADKLLVAEKFGKELQLGVYKFYDGAIAAELADDVPIEEDFQYTWRSLEQKPISLDFMGTLNNPKAKSMIWTAIQDSILKGDTDALRESGISKEQLSVFNDYIKSSGCQPMEFRDYALTQEGMKKAVGAYCSIGAEASQLNVCSVYEDTIDFLTIAKALGHPVEIFSTIGVPEGYRGLPEIMLGNKTLSEYYQLFLKSFGERAETAADLVTEYVVSKKKKTEPGQAVLEETVSKGLHLYVDDELKIVENTIEVLGAQNNITLPILCRIERDGVKDAGYESLTEHKNIADIVVVNSLMNNKLLDKLYLK